MGFSLAQGHDWFNIVEVLIFVVGGGLFTIVATRITARRANVPVMDELRNGHDKPLRKDIDRILSNLEDMRLAHTETKELLLDTHRLVTDHGTDLVSLRGEVDDLDRRVDNITPRRHRKAE